MKTTNAPLRLGLAGLSHDHISIVSQIAADDFEIVGAYDPDAALRAAVGRQYAIAPERLFGDLPTMLGATKPHAVAAFGPIVDHLAVVEACAPAGVHVMVEKPLAVDVADADRIAELARLHGVHVLTNYETSWYASNEYIFQAVRRGVIGAPRKVLIRDGHQGPVESGCQPQFLAWLTTSVSSGGGALNDFGCYGANLMTFLMEGRLPNSVTAITRTFKPELYGSVEDDALIVLAYDALEAIIQASWNWPFARKDIEIHGATGTIAAADQQTVWLRCANDPEARPIVPDPLPYARGAPFAHLASVILGEERPARHALSALDNNIGVVRILDAARRSAIAGRTVLLTDSAA
jgi:predicted dehydrogenase